MPSMASPIGVSLKLLPWIPSIEMNVSPAASPVLFAGSRSTCPCRLTRVVHGVPEVDGWVLQTRLQTVLLTTVCTSSYPFSFPTGGDDGNRREKTVAAVAALSPRPLDSVGRGVSVPVHSRGAGRRCAPRLAARAAWLCRPPRHSPSNCGRAIYYQPAASAREALHLLRTRCSGSADHSCVYRVAP